MLLALTRGVSDSLAACELTHLRRTPIDLGLAREQHGRYEDALRRAGCRVVSMPALHEFPDAVFVEDVAVILDEIAIITRPGAQSRRPETTTVAAALESWRPVVQIEEPGTVEGGDVLRVGRRIFVGRSGRTNDEGILQLAALAAPHGYEVIPVSVSGCLHLKSAVTEVAPGTILVNREWVSPAAFDDMNVVAVDPSEPYAANALFVAGSLAPPVRGSGPTLHAPGPSGSGNPATIYPSSFPRTARVLESLSIPLDIIDMSELRKAEGAVTCCSLVFRV